MSITTGPIVATALWQTVMEQADQRCQCTNGMCGSQHSKSALRCDRTTEHDRLLAAPLDLTLSPVAAASVPTGELRAWCANCHRGALAQQRADDRERKRQQSAADEPLALF